MKKLLTTMFVGLLMVGCGEKTHYSPPLTEEEVKIIAEAIDGDTLQKGGEKGEELSYAPNQQTPHTGWVKEMYDNGQIKDLLQYEDGKMDGLASNWDVNGQKKIEGNYKDGKMDGLATSWYENGQKNWESNYKDGKKDGPITSWYENGQKNSEENYKDGKLDGLFTSCYENGQKSSEENYKDGKAFAIVVWNPNGEKCPVTNIVDGDGIWVEYSPDGTEKSRSTYKDGELVKTK